LLDLGLVHDTMTDYGVYKGARGSTASRDSSRDSQSGGKAPSPRPAPKRSDNLPSATVVKAIPPAGTEFVNEERASRYEPLEATPERAKPLVGSTAGECHVNESGCPNCGSKKARSGAVYCDSCGFGIAGRNYSQPAAVGSSFLGGSGTEWRFDPNRYGLFGWIETVLGVIGLAVGYATLAVFANPGIPLTSYRIAEIVFVILFLLVLIFQAVQRFFYHEILAFVYGCLAVGGQVCATIVVFNHGPSPGTYYVVIFFAWMMAMSVKLFWLACVPMDETGRFRVHEHPILDSKLKLIIITIFCLVVNLAGFIVQLIILTETFEEQ